MTSTVEQLRSGGGKKKEERDERKVPKGGEGHRNLFTHFYSHRPFAAGRGGKETGEEEGKGLGREGGERKGYTSPLFFPSHISLPYPRGELSGQ